MSAHGGEANAPEGIRGGEFARWQPIYAEHRIPTFPVIITSDAKRPAVKGYLKLGRAYSEKLVQKFPSADAFGFVVGQRSRITVLDVDSRDERVLADALDRHGKSPLIVRSGSGHFQAWFKWNGERRSIRPNPEKPVDILGGGYVVAPPSWGAKGQYRIIQGSLDDLDRLPVMQGIEQVTQEIKPRVARSSKPSRSKPTLITEGNRNDALWRHCMMQARTCDDFDALLDVAKTFNEFSFEAPLSAEEVTKAACSAWQMTQQGRNWFGQHGMWSPTEEVNEFLTHGGQDEFVLLSFLRANNGPDREFMIANKLHETLGWGRKRLANARSSLINRHYLRQTYKAHTGHAGLYRWSGGEKRKKKGKVLVEDRWSGSTTLGRGGP